MPHATLARIVGARRAIVALVTAVLGVIVAFGVPVSSGQQHIILGVIGLIFSWIGGDAYIQGKHVQASAATAVAHTQAVAAQAATSKAPAADPNQTVTPSTGS